MMVSVVSTANLGTDFDLSDTVGKKISINRGSRTVQGLLALQISTDYATVAARSDDAQAVTAGYLQAALAAQVDLALTGLQSYNVVTNVATFEMTDGSTVDVDFTALINDAVGSSVISFASESEAGRIEIATQAEVNTGTDTFRAVTPATLKSVTDAITAGGGYVLPAATDTVLGGVQTPTAAEVTAATATDKVPTVADVATMIGAIAAGPAAQSSTTTVGVVELATVAEATTGTDTVRAVTPAGLAAAIGATVTGNEAVTDAFGDPLFTALT